MPTLVLAGDSGMGRFGVRLEDPQAAVDQAVLFLNVVRSDPRRNFPQAAHLVFAGASEEPAVFRRVLSGEELRFGVETVLNFQTKRGAPPGEYVLVLQLFRGSGTDPHRVKVEDRIGIAFFPFTVSADR